MDYFKSVNDTYGHAIGDLALKKVASILEECFRSNDFPIRFGEDLFEKADGALYKTKQNVQPYFLLIFLIPLMNISIIFIAISLVCGGFVNLIYKVCNRGKRIQFVYGVVKKAYIFLHEI